MNKVIKKIVVVLMLIVLFYQCSALILGFASIESKQLSVTTVDDYIETDEYTIEKKISFKQKKYLGLGRYGFIKRIVIENPVVVEQDLIGADYSPFVSFGIYNDSSLLSAVDSVNKTKELKDDIAMELGMSDGATEKSIITILKPGTYYCAAFCFNPFLQKSFSYHCYLRDTKTKKDIVPNKTYYYDVNSSKQVNEFKVKLKKGNTSIILGHECRKITVKKDKDNLKETKSYDNVNNSDKKMQFEVNTNGTYDIIINHYDRTYSEEPMKIRIKN